MPNLVPLRLVISPFPPDFTGSPQDIADAIEQRAEIVTDQAYSLFVIGPTAPISDEGPWFKNGVTPWVWDVGTGAYVPVILDPKSLRYVLTQTLPTDDTDYDVVFKLDPGSSPAGAPEDVLVWYNGAWASIVGVSLSYLTGNYYDKTQTDAQIAAAIAAGSASQKRYPFFACKSAGIQTITAGTPVAQVIFDREKFDPDNVFDSNVFTAPVNGYYNFTAALSINPLSGTPTNLSIAMEIRVNLARYAAMNNYSGGIDLCSYNFSTNVFLNAGDQVDVSVVITTTGASTWGVLNDGSITFFTGALIQAT